MSGDVLSQSEVETLLSAMAGGGRPEGKADGPAPARPEPAGQAAALGAASLPSRPHAEITPYDFKRPGLVDKGKMQALRTLHEGFGRSFAVGLSAMLRGMVEVRLTGVNLLTYGEFVSGLENPTCFNLLTAEPLEGHLILDINPSILYPIIDRLLGGRQEISPLARRPLTEIELRLVARITSLFLDELRRAWENVLALTPEVVRVESNPESVQIVPSDEVVVLIRFEVTLGEVQGMFNLCIPYNSIERIGEKLSANTRVTCGRQAATPENIEQITQSLRGSLVRMKVRLARSRVTAGELIGLQVGDVITTQKDVESPLLVSVEGVPKFRATAGAFKGHKAIRIHEVIENPTEAIGD